MDTVSLLFGIIIGLIVLVFLVVIHELGHAIVASRNGVKVEEFGIGFPPRAYKKRLKNGVLFTLNYLPLGGFVKLQGEHDSASGIGDYGAANFWQKTKILLAGVLVNWLMAALLLTILAVTGLPKILPNQFTVPSDTTVSSEVVSIADVAKGSPADRGGLHPNDILLSINGTSIESPQGLVDATSQNKGRVITLSYSRDNTIKTLTTQLNSDTNNNQGYLGVTPQQKIPTIKATWSTPIVGIATTGQFTWVTLQGLGTLVSNATTGFVQQFSSDSTTAQTGKDKLTEAGNSVAGPVGILGKIFPEAEQAGLTRVVLLAAIISLTLAVMNILPIPALDGGRFFTMAIFRILRKPLTKEREERIQATGFLVLIALVILVTIADVAKF